MDIDKFSGQIKEWRSQLTKLLQRTHESPPSEELLAETFEELHMAVEELMSAEEELYHQNEELLLAQVSIESERQRYQDFFEFAPDGYLLTDPQGMIREVNRAAANLLNVSQKFLVNKPLANFILMEERQSFRSHLKQLPERDRFQDWEVRLQPRKRKPIDASITMGLVRDRTGKLLALRWLLRDVTERKQAELERAQLLLREQTARKKAVSEATRSAAAQAFVTSVLESITDALITLDTEWRYTYVNSQAEKILGKSSQELIGDSIWEVFPTAINSQSYQLFHQAIADQVTVAYEEFSPLFQKWFAFRLYPSPNGLSVYFIDVTECKQTEQALQQSEAQFRRLAEELTQANRMKDEFLAVVSHELRSPLSTILGWAQMLRSGSLDSTLTIRAGEVIEDSAKTQKQLIEDLLDVSQIITGKLRLHVCSVELVPILEAAIEAVRPAADAKQIRLELVLETQQASILGNSDRLQQVMWNLLSNAIKFTPQGGWVQVRLISINRAIEISVSDSGIGICPEFLPFVFERFRQADSTTTRSYGGMGLGLAIARHLIELHGGTVQVDSPGEGQGTTFTVRLPSLIENQPLKEE